MLSEYRNINVNDALEWSTAALRDTHTRHRTAAMKTRHATVSLQSLVVGDPAEWQAQTTT